MDSTKQNTARCHENQGKSKSNGSSIKINASTHFDTCDARMTAFGGLLGLVKFIDLLKFEEVFEDYFAFGKRQCALGHYKMVLGLLMLMHGETGDGKQVTGIDYLINTYYIC